MERTAKREMTPEEIEAEAIWQIHKADVEQMIEERLSEDQETIRLLTEDRDLWADKTHQLANYLLIMIQHGNMGLTQEQIEDIREWAGTGMVAR